MVENKILIITTEGCEACNIAEKNVKSALMQFSKDVEIEVKDRSECKKIIKQNNIKDFPAVLYITYNVIRCKHIGSYPIPVYLRWMDMYFKK